MGYGSVHLGPLDSAMDLRAVSDPEAVNSMFVQHASDAPILRECPDRRRGERFVHVEPVQIDGRPVIGCDISAKGMAVLMRRPVMVGTVVQVTLSSESHPDGILTTSARVARIGGRAERPIVGLEFVR